MDPTGNLSEQQGGQKQTLQQITSESAPHCTSSSYIDQSDVMAQTPGQPEEPVCVSGLSSEWMCLPDVGADMMMGAVMSSPLHLVVRY